MPVPLQARAKRGLVSVLAVAALVLAGCATGDNQDATADNSLTIGTTGEAVSLDPAGTFDDASFLIQTQVYPYLFNTDYDDNEIVADLAESGEFTTTTEYTVTLPAGLTWANGNDLTSSDVKFSFDRILAINDPAGPASMLSGLARVDVPDPQTVVFTLKQANDQSFPAVLASYPGAILDEQVFSADALTDAAVIVDGNAFGGPYVLTEYEAGDSATFEPNPEYQGLLAAASNDSVVLKHYETSAQLTAALTAGDVDVAYGGLAPADVAELSADRDLTVHEGPGDEVRSLVFDPTTQPFGTTAETPDPAKALAIRQAIASLVDRDGLATTVFQGTFAPVYSVVPAGIAGATEIYQDLYGDGDGAPDPAPAEAALLAAGVVTPVEITLEYGDGGPFGQHSGDEFTALAAQLEDGDLFEVTLKAVDPEEYGQALTSGTLKVFEYARTGEYTDADTYLLPYQTASRLLVNHATDAALETLIASQGIEIDPDLRETQIVDAQARIAQLLTVIPLLQSTQIAVSATGVDGVVLDASSKFRFASLTR